jgi:transcriptional regulator with XRE-family HTH domain
MELQAPLKRRKRGTYTLPGLRRLRDERGYSMRELAVLSELTLDTIWRVENLQRGAEARTRRKLAEALDTTIKELRTPNEEANEKEK